MKKSLRWRKDLAHVLAFKRWCSLFNCHSKSFLRNIRWKIPFFFRLYLNVNSNHVKCSKQNIQHNFRVRKWLALLPDSATLETRCLFICLFIYFRILSCKISNQVFGLRCVSTKSTILLTSALKPSHQWHDVTRLCDHWRVNGSALKRIYCSKHDWKSWRSQVFKVNSIVYWLSHCPYKKRHVHLLAFITFYLILLCRSFWRCLLKIPLW